MNLCPHCGAELNADSAGGLCPACLIAGVLETEVTTGFGKADPPSNTADGRGDVEDDRFGPYRILRLIGEGGMGSVYLAEQTRPIHRQVALKVIKLGMDSEQVVARFASERQTLALMEHPNIAHVYEAGTSDRGRPYFVMEYVDGVPITQYCDQHVLNTRERLEVFGSVCLALQHAHQKGVIHRDIKPSNVLVTEQDGKPFPKVIDFGHRQSNRSAAGGVHRVYPVGELRRHAGIHESGADGLEQPGYRHHNGRLLAGSAAVRIASRGVAVRRALAARGGDGGVAADHSRGRRAHAIGQADETGRYGGGS